MSGRVKLAFACAPVGLAVCGWVWWEFVRLVLA